jgi:lipopolysaccharide biosynthesis protein
VGDFLGSCGSMMRDAAVQIRQLIRDLGLTPGGVRQVAKVLRRTVSGARPESLIAGLRRHGSYDFSMAVPFGFVSGNPPPSALRIAAACHVFYPDLSAEFRDALDRIPGRVDVVLSTDTDAKRAEIARAFAGWENGEVDVRIVANRGRDIAPKLTAYGDLRDRYDLVLYLHSKRHISRNPDGSVLNDGSDWRRYLLHTLAGSPAIVGSILEAFHRDPRLGIVMAQHWEPVRDWINWADNFFVARNLARRMGVRLTPGHAIDFPSGSMFWARPATLGPILDLGLRAEDFPGEADQEEGTVAHAVERLFLFACEAAGYRWAKVCDPVESTYPGAVIRIDTPEALYAYHRRYGFRLTALGPP